MDRDTIQLFEQAMLDSGRGRRFTQDSPILPDVWLAYAAEPLARVDLLLTPHWGTEAGALAHRLAKRIEEERGEEVWQEWARKFERKFEYRSHRRSARIAYTNSTVAAALRFDELIRVVLPMTEWWNKYVWKAASPVGGVAEALGKESVVNSLAELLVDPDLLRTAGDEAAAELPGVTADLVWMTRLVGLIAVQVEKGNDETAQTFLAGSDKPLSARLKAAKQMIAATRSLVEGMRGPAIEEETETEKREETADEGEPSGVEEEATLEDKPSVYMVNRNRPAEASVFDSALAVKADAARRLFDIRCNDITWAVVDSGIDATHPAFRARDAKTPGRPLLVEKNRRRKVRFPYQTRVKATFDFSLVRYLLSPNADALEERIGELRYKIQFEPRSPRAMAHLSELESLEKLRRLLYPHDDGLENRIKLLKETLADLSDSEVPLDRLLREEKARLDKLLEKYPSPASDPKSLSDREEKTQDLRRGLEQGRAIDWQQLQEFLRIPHDESYRAPRHNHGTHVAGILGGEWLARDADDNDEGGPGERELIGVAPDISLYDLRVLGDDGTGDEFSVIAALQFVRYLNDNSDVMMVHGANLSLSIRHAVSNYACGRTPVCEESERLVGTGVMVVAAGGNGGYLKLRTSEGDISEGYATVSITDPGNAESVLTVGATHRSFPHAYGVSYFSSRGPTGDGRLKPDLVAPGEKITAPIPGGQSARLDGTSMAAPHASGAAALLMARHRELMGQPARIKQILCETATDLGRERYFQGAGMLDALRALQSV